jgi:predicted phage terminase large subunit-like protein
MSMRAAPSSDTSQLNADEEAELWLAAVAELEERDKQERIAAIASDREACKSLSEFIKRAWHVIEPGTVYKDNWHIQAMAEHLEAVQRGEIRRIIINVPPGASKSTVCGVFFPMWCWGPMGAAHTRFLGVAHEQSLGVRDNLKCRRLVQSEWFQERWPVQIMSDQNEKLNFENSATGFRSVATPSNITGRRANCLVGSSMIMTSHGMKRIDQINIATNSCYVQSYDAHTRRVVYRQVEAVARRSSPVFYRVHTASGGVVECTGDHRIYTTRGYVEARLLSADDVLLRVVPEGREAQRLCHEEGREARRSGDLLQPVMQPDCHQSSAREIRADVHRMSEPSPARQASVFGSLQKDSQETSDGSIRLANPDASVRDVRGHVSPSYAGGRQSVLLTSLQGQGAFAGYDGRGQSGLARWCAYRKSRDTGAADHHQGAEAAAHRAGWRLRGMQDDGKSADAPHRHECVEQSAEQSGCPVQRLPHGISCSRAGETQADTVAVVERVCQPTDVYDIQVAGTHCFFANGILVHNCVIIDDAISVENANSVVEREKVNLWFQESLPTRLNDPEKSAIVLVMQRVHEDDPTGMILSKGWGWDHLMIPMEYEPERASTTSIAWKDPRTTAGELFFPDRFPAPVVEEYRKTLGAFAYAGQMMQRPAPREGAMFKRAWFKPLKAAPAGCRWVRYWDLAATEAQFGSDPDYTVGLKLGRMQDGRFIIADVNRLRAEGTGVRRMIRETAKDDGRYCEIGLPQDPGQAGKIQAQDLAAMLAGYVVGVERETGDKITRAEPIAAQAEAGNVYYVEGDWNEAFFSEVTLFPGSKHKDQVDALSGAFSKIMRSNMFGVQEEMVAIDPIKIVSLWGRVAAIDVGPTNVSIVFGAWNQTTDTLMVYEAYTAPRGPLPVHVDLIRRLHPAGTTGMWIPVLFSMKDHGRTEEEGAKLAGALANLGPQIITVPLDMEAAVSEMAERLSTRRLRVFGDQPDWFASYRRFTRDEKGEISGDNDGLLRATGLIALWGKDSAVTENRAISDGEGFDRAQYERKRSVTGY